MNRTSNRLLKWDEVEPEAKVNALVSKWAVDSMAL